MRFYKGAHEYLHKVQTLPIEEQCLYLVADVSNEHDIHAVMLHNGKQKLGSVNANQAPAIKRLLTKWKEDNKGVDDVIVVKIGHITLNPKDFEFSGAVKSWGHYRVNERRARKFSDQFRKD